jgi:electron transfer flavoprotein alpha/beta subunit
MSRSRTTTTCTQTVDATATTEAAQPPGGGLRSAPRELHLGVLLRRLPKVPLRGGGRSATHTAAQPLSALGPCERAALSAALGLHQTLGAPNGAAKPVALTAVAVGSAYEDGALEDALELGVSRAVRLDAPRVDRLAPQVVAEALARLVDQLGISTVLVGDRSVHHGVGATGPMVAALLGRPSLTGVEELTWGSAPARTSAERGEAQPLAGVALRAKQRLDTWRYEWILPAVCVIAVRRSEGAAAAARPADDGAAPRGARSAAAAPARAVEVYTLQQLGLRSSVLERASRPLTIVTERQRSAMMLDSGARLVGRLRAAGLLRP